MPEYVIERTVRRRALWALTLSLVAIMVWLAAAPAALATPRGGHRGRQQAGNSSATITASFADSCRDFAAHSSKDISHVVFHYVDGRVGKDECIRRHDYAVDGGAGDEIEFAIVKSGTTSEQFDCVPSNRAPTARLEIQTPPIDQTLEHCYDFFSGGLGCEQSSPRTVWTSAGKIPTDGGEESGFFHWGCGAFSDPSLCPLAVRFRGAGSSDPDADITSWSLDFGDGTSLSGNWSAAPPTEIAHEYSRDPSGAIKCAAVVNSISNVCVITLTVTDSAGQSHSDAMPMVFIDQTPD